MRLILIFLAVAVVAGCQKDKFTTKPQLKIKSINSTDISGADVLQITINITDKEGDYSSFFAIKKTIANCPAGNYIDSSSKFSIPQGFLDTKKNEGDIIIALDKKDRGANFCSGPGGSVKIDTAIFSFWTRDLAGNKSDTVYTQPIIIRN